MELLASFLDVALDCTWRGWYVFPCNGKIPIEAGGYKTASNDAAKIREWWTQYPHANVGIATGASGITVLDIDTGLTDEQSLCHFVAAHDLPETFAVRTGKRPDYRVQLYYTDAIPSFNHWELDGHAGDVRGTWGHVMAAGSIHPESKEPYAVLWNLPLASVPNSVRALKPRAKERTVDLNAPITEWRNDTLFRVLCKHRANCADDEMIRDFALRKNAQMPVPLDEDELETIIGNVCKLPVGEPEPVVIIGGNKAAAEDKPLADWRTLFHSRDAMLNAPPITFLIKDFLQREGVTAIAAPVRERKSLIALNICHALLTGEKLFGHFEVVSKPSRVLYLCPEVSLGPFTDRLRKIRLINYVGDTLFCRTLSADGHLALNMPELQPALPGSVVILDTAIRFLEGDENSSKDVRAFADSIFALLRDGAESVVMLHHSPKDAGEYMTLENAMRGSGDMGAFHALYFKQLRHLDG